jgi:cell division septum initiation protein DivIVA
MEANIKVGTIEALQKQIQDLNAQAENKTSYWMKLDRMCENLRSDQQRHLNTCNEVIKAKEQLVDSFNLFLFENFREQFAASEKYKIVCDNYIDSIQDSLTDYSTNMEKLREENEKLRKLLEENNNPKGGYCED